MAVPSFAEPAKPDNKKVEGDYVISSEAVNFLKDHNVDLNPFKKSNIKNDMIYSEQSEAAPISQSASYDEKVLFLKNETAAYNFNDDQIQKYINGIVNTTPTIVSTANTSSTLNKPYSQNRPNDKGIGYEVLSNAGYYGSTAFAVIPNAWAPVDYATSGYMFWTLEAPGAAYAVDLGLWYGWGWGGYGWRGVYNTNDPAFLPEPQKATTDILTALTPGKEIYMKLFIRSDGYAETVVLDANDFSIVIADFIFYVSGWGIYQSNGVFNRQISLCQGDKNFSNGAYMNNAQFSLAYLYQSNGNYAPVTSSNTILGRTGAFGTNNVDVEKVSVNSYTQWDSENITIKF